VNELSRWRRTCFVIFLCTATAASSAQTFTTLHSFNVTAPEGPKSGLVQATNGNLYGTTFLGGTGEMGTVFMVTPGGKLKTLQSFNGTNGSGPSGLVLATNGNLYGTTSAGGADFFECGGASCGTVFQIAPAGALTTLHSFDGTDEGGNPISYTGLVQATNRSFYGATNKGGAYGFGTLFKITAAGTLTTLHSFDPINGEGVGMAGLVQATNGYLYGTTDEGGTDGSGTVFRITPTGALTTLYNFSLAAGAGPYAGLIQATDGNLYGTTQIGGTYSMGTVFKITPTGTQTTLYNFSGADGSYPEAGLVQATDGNFYGTTFQGGANGEGTIFQISPTGTLATLYSFCNQAHCSDGANPGAGLVQATDGSFYGTTEKGGTGNNCSPGCGTVFRLSVGLGPFVETLPASGKVGAAIRILGTNLTGATSVSFNGTAAAFTVVSASQISATVPDGATTGQVQVVTPGGTLSSNIAFRMTP